MLYRSRARMKLRSSIRNYSVEAFYNDVPECVGMKTSCKTREIHSFSMTFRQMISCAQNRMNTYLIVACSPCYVQ